MKGAVLNFKENLYEIVLSSRFTLLVQYVLQIINLPNLLEMIFIDISNVIIKACSTCPKIVKMNVFIRD